jgi:hypothetical protein
MIFNADATSDIERYYYNTLIKLSQTGQRLWRVVSVSKAQVQLVDLDGFDLYIPLDQDFEVSYVLPGRAVFQRGHHACMVYRKPAKQYQRGCSPNNTAMAHLHASGWKDTSWGMGEMQQFVDKPCYQDPNNLDYAYNSWAITPLISVRKEDWLVYILKKPVGRLFPDEKRLQISRPIFTPEITAAFPGWSIL